MCREFKVMIISYSFINQCVYPLKSFFLLTQAWTTRRAAGSSTRTLLLQSRAWRRASCQSRTPEAPKKNERKIKEEYGKKREIMCKKCAGHEQTNTQIVQGRSKKCAKQRTIELPTLLKKKKRNNSLSLLSSPA